MIIFADVRSIAKMIDLWQQGAVPIAGAAE